MSHQDLAYQYAPLQLVPSPLRGCALTVGVVLHARAAEFLDLRLDLAPERWRRCLPGLDVELAGRALESYARICRGGPEGGPIGLLPPGERFHWLTAPRSAVLRPGPVQGGRSGDPVATLERLFREGCGAGGEADGR